MSRLVGYAGAVLVVAGLQLGASSPAQAHDTRPCVSKVEFNSVSSWERRDQLEARWDVTGLGKRVSVLAYGSAVIYPRCGFSFPDEAWYGVSYTPGTNGRHLWSTGLVWWRADDAAPHGHLREFPRAAASGKAAS